MKPRLNYPNVVSSLALFIALGGGAYAATLPRDSVGTPQLKKNAVTTAKVKNGTLRTSDFRKGTLLAGPAGPAGPTGPAGAPGAQGERGPAGSDAKFDGAAAGGHLTGTYPNPQIAPSVLAGLLPGTRVRFDADEVTPAEGYRPMVTVPGEGVLEVRCDTDAASVTVRWRNQSAAPQRVFMHWTHESGSEETYGALVAQSSSITVSSLATDTGNVGQIFTVKMEGAAADLEATIYGLTRQLGQTHCAIYADGVLR